MKQKIALATVVAALALGGAAYAHHSLDGEFDQNDMVTIKGVISKVDWINPHVYFTVDVKDAKGNITKWQAETVPVAIHVRQRDEIRRRPRHNFCRIQRRSELGRNNDDTQSRLSVCYSYADNGTGSCADACRASCCRT
jgi:hypothetical protein